MLPTWSARSHGAIVLVIKNFGPSSAADVQVAFDPPAPAAADVAALPDSDMKKWLYQRFAEPVPAWAPGWATSNVIRSGQDPLEAFTVTLSYSGSDGTKYTEPFLLQPDHIIKETTATPEQDRQPHQARSAGRVCPAGTGQDAEKPLDLGTGDAPALREEVVRARDPLCAPVLD